MRIDAHQHYWKLDRGDYNWLNPELSKLYRDFLPSDLTPILHTHNIDKTVLVQAAPTLAETEYMLALAEHDLTIAGVVGWLDLESNVFPALFQQLMTHTKFVGIRPMLHDLPDDEWILRPKVIQSLKLLAEYDFPVDFLIYSRHLPHLNKLIQQVPNLRGVVDHIGKPNIAKGEMEPWRTQIAELASGTNIYCKLSGMVTEANHMEWDYKQLSPYIQHCLDVFGTDRVMFGSDWPVCLLVASYDEVVSILEGHISSNLNQADLSKVWGYNAIDFYRLQV
ncbi:amidohydrolase [Paenibacillus sp. MY03]|uniref:amidohydrolase family protein n=1 Tax=Paenibacillus sp. MY03 TaxID=302980 RepID=UPI000B3CAB58|nr:amidohydrolase family protein [Paenibacillus sp. MY03]OUS69602.1 amidohydrolase [Paenibacillus sp. MY03]